MDAILGGVGISALLQAGNVAIDYGMGKYSESQLQSLFNNNSTRGKQNIRNWLNQYGPGNTGVDQRSSTMYTQSMARAIAQLTPSLQKNFVDYISGKNSSSKETPGTALQNTGRFGNLDLKSFGVYLDSYNNAVSSFRDKQNTGT